MALTRVINSGIGVAASIAGEGTATTSLQQGLSKFWANIDQIGTAQLVDSLNCSGITDNGTGDEDEEETDYDQKEEQQRKAVFNLDIN